LSAKNVKFGFKLGAAFLAFKLDSLWISNQESNRGQRDKLED